MEKEVYVVMCSTGVYDTRFEHPEVAFTDKAKAEKYVNEKNTHYNEMLGIANDKDKSESVTIAQNEMFEKYLETEHPDIYEKCIKDYDLTEESVWNEYDDIESAFYDDEELISKYADAVGVDDETRKLMTVFKEYWEAEDCGTLPHYYVKEVKLAD